MNAPDPAPSSPMMVAHATVRGGAPGHLILFRVGEFYEMLGTDAAMLARAPGLPLAPAPEGCA